MDDKQVRQAVLEAMNSQRKNSRHEREIRMHVSEIVRKVRSKGFECNEKQIMQAVDYLQEAGMIKRTQETQTIKTPSSMRSSRSIGSGSYKSTTYWYKLSVKAIDKLDGETEFSSKPFVPLQHIQINTSNAPVLIGSNNLVNNNVAVFKELDELQNIIASAENIEVEERQDAASDIESLKQQLAKPNPNQSVVNLLWKNIGRVADLAGAGALATQVVKVIAATVGHPIG